MELRPGHSGFVVDRSVDMRGAVVPWIVLSFQKQANNRTDAQHVFMLLLLMWIDEINEQTNLYC